MRFERQGNAMPARVVVCKFPHQIEGIENGVVVTRHAAVVGKPDRRHGNQQRIVEINFNPYWTVRLDCTRDCFRDAKPADYLTKNHIRIRSAATTPRRRSMVFGRGG